MQMLCLFVLWLCSLVVSGDYVFLYVNQTCKNFMLPNLSLNHLSSLSDQNWSEHVNVRKGLLPGLWSFLKSGGHGSAKITYPCILPLLSILTDKVCICNVLYEG